MARRSTPLTLFYSYAHEDEALRDQLETHLSLLKREGVLSFWHKRALLPGDDWARQIDQYLNDADLILLLVSADFLASDYCYDVEMARALKRHQRREARVVPILLRDCDWSSAPFGTLQALPRNGKPITSWPNQDEAFTQVAQNLRRLLADQGSAPTLPTSRSALTKAQYNRETMQRRLEQWFQGFLSQSLQEAAWLDLGFAEKPDALANPISLLLPGTTLPNRLLPPGTSILQVYDEAHQELLILGEPGAGKSTQLYMLGKQLLTRTATDPHAPLPFVFALSSWANKQAALETWMEEQLVVLYQFSKRLARQWVQDRQVLPLLDGLDEMPEEARPRCIEEINRYHQEHLHPLVVCCRNAEYATATKHTRLSLQQAVVVQPLSQSQITTILTDGGKALSGLRTAYKQNTALQELATTPLLLHLLMLTYHNVAVRDLPTQEQRLLKHVLHAYVTRMINQKGNNTRYPYEITTRWLHTLAAQMHRHNLVEWGIEQLQPDWLPQTFQRRYIWSLGLSGGVIGGVIGGLIGELSGGVIGGLSLGLIFELGRGLSGTINMTERIKWSWKAALFGLIAELSVGLISGLIFGLSAGPIFELSAGLIIGLSVGLEPKQFLDRSASSPGDGLDKTLQMGLIFGLIFGLSVGSISGLIFGLSVGLISGLSVGLGTGLNAFTRQPHFLATAWRQERPLLSCI